MVYKRVILGDANVVRSWQAAQVAMPQLLGVQLYPVSCFDTLSASLESVTTEADFAVVSVVTALLLDEGSGTDVKGTCCNILEGVVKRVCSVAKRHSRVQVRVPI